MYYVIRLVSVVCVHAAREYLTKIGLAARTFSREIGSAALQQIYKFRAVSLIARPNYT